MRWRLVRRFKKCLLPKLSTFIPVLVLLLCCVSIQMEMCFIGESCDTQDKRTSLQLRSVLLAKSNLSLFFLLTTVDSVEFCAKTKTSHHDRFFVQFRLRPQFTALHVARIFLISCYCLPSSAEADAPTLHLFACLSRTLPVSSDCLTVR
jgi:hypothetical protein